MRFRILVEFDPETGHYTATVQDRPIFVDATSKREALKLAREAIVFYLEETAK